MANARSANASTPHTPADTVKAGEEIKAAADKAAETTGKKARKKSERKPTSERLYNAGAVVGKLAGKFPDAAIKKELRGIAARVQMLSMQLPDETPATPDETPKASA